MLVFKERGKPEFAEKNLSEQRREPTNSAHIWRRVRESNPGHIGGRRALSPLREPTPYNDKLVNDIIYSGVVIKLFLTRESCPENMAISFLTWKPPGIAKVGFSF